MGLRSRAHTVGKGLKPAASTRRVFLLDLYDFVLHIEQVGDELAESLGPEVIAGFGVD